MTIASELLWQLAPPLVFATDAPGGRGHVGARYDNGGDALDYAINDGILHLGVFDAMGHGLAAAGVAAFALSAYRHSRRRARAAGDLCRDGRGGRRAVPGRALVTAVIANSTLDRAPAWISAGHPPPLVIRDGRLSRTLTARRPRRWASSWRARPVVAEESLGARRPAAALHGRPDRGAAPDGQMFTVEGLGEFIEREAAAGQTAPETLRRLRHAILDRQPRPAQGRRHRAARRVAPGAEADLLPQTAQRHVPTASAHPTAPGSGSQTWRRRRFAHRHDAVQLRGVRLHRPVPAAVDHVLHGLPTARTAASTYQRAHRCSALRRPPKRCRDLAAQLGGS